ncbi:hypothetical protein [Streptomyces murinus]|uniref:hypothetical protein n=1 Tax=Streptomyces murinus TaxID=33900 RepID=UPI0021143BBC|nr:hypothetical protein [Streptomyces murinus]
MRVRCCAGRGTRTPSSRDGFSETDLDVLARIRAVTIDVEADKLSTPAQAPPARAQSGLDSL